MHCCNGSLCNEYVPPQENQQKGDDKGWYFNTLNKGESFNKLESCHDTSLIKFFFVSYYYLTAKTMKRLQSNKEECNWLENKKALCEMAQGTMNVLRIMYYSLGDTVIRGKKHIGALGFVSRVCLCQLLNNTSFSFINQV